jgi:hypothetical protein
MNPIFGWTLALAGIVAGTTMYGWQGLVLASTIVAFWLILQFGQVMRVMRRASSSPVGHVDSAVMLHSKLHRGMRLLDVVKLTRSLGRKAGGPPPGRSQGGPAPSGGSERSARGGTSTSNGAEVFTWSDQAGNHVTATFAGGHLRSWKLERPALSEVEGPAPATAPDAVEEKNTAREGP